MNRLIVLGCSMLSIQQFRELNDAWNNTKQQVASVYQMAQDHCQLDQWQFCESPRYYGPELPFLFGETDLVMTLMWISLEHDNIPLFVDSSTTWIWISSVHSEAKPEELDLPSRSSNPEQVLANMHAHLRTETTRRRRLTEEAFPCTRGSSCPSHCLQTAWMDQRVRPECSWALHRLQRKLELKRQQAWILKAMGVAFAMWMCYVFRKLLRGHNESSNECDACCCCCNKDDCCSGNCSKEDGSCSDSKQARVPNSQQIDICVCCCCKTSSDHPLVEESCCNCCKGTGVCSAACATCCSDACSCVLHPPPSSPAVIEEEVPIRIPIV